MNKTIQKRMKIYQRMIVSLFLWKKKNLIQLKKKANNQLMKAKLMFKHLKLHKISRKLIQILLGLMRHFRKIILSFIAIFSQGSQKMDALSIP